MIFGKKKKETAVTPQLVAAQRSPLRNTVLPSAVEPYEKELYDRLRFAVPIIDAAIMKMIRLTGGFRVICSDEEYQDGLDRFLENVPVGISGRSVGTFVDNFLDSMLTYGSAVGEIASDPDSRRIAGLWIGDVSRIRVSGGKDPFSRQ